MKIPPLFPPPKEGDHQLFRNIARLKVEFTNPATGDIFKTEATAFSQSVGLKSWVVTNRHCLDVHYGDRKGKGLVLTALWIIYPGPRDGNKFYQFSCDLDRVEFSFCDEGDLAGIPSDALTTGPDGGYATFNLYDQIVVNDSFFDNVSVGSEVVFIGYPARLWDQNNHLPILRNSSISSIPSFNYSIEDQVDEPRVLVSGMSLGGNSGSPVFFQTKVSLVLVGVMSGHYFSDATHKWTSEIVDAEQNASHALRTHTGLSYFVKSHLLHKIASWPKKSRHGQST